MALEEISSSMEQLDGQTRSNADNAKAANQKAIERGAQVIVGTPGRIMDLQSRGQIHFKNIRFAILDFSEFRRLNRFRHELSPQPK
ncbi:MAG: DEAD/DEAH box helicase [Acidobacteriota bacterium]